MTSGSKFSPPANLEKIFAALRQESDSALDVIPNGSEHATFLALSPHEWSRGILPAEMPVLKTIAEKILPFIQFELHDLRLVAHPNCLLLAGIPHFNAWNAQKEFASALINSRWKSHIERRYKNFPIPPLLWHTTITRYKAFQIGTIPIKIDKSR